MKILLGGAINLSRISVTIDKAIMCGKTNKFFIKKWRNICMKKILYRILLHRTVQNTVELVFF